MMKYLYLKFPLFLISLIGMSTIVSCGDDEEEQEPTHQQNTDETEKEDSIFTFTGQSLYDNLTSNHAFSCFTYLLQRTGYDKNLSTYGTITVFVPTNKGLEAYASKLYNDITANTPHHGMSENSVEGLPDSICQRIVKQHIISSAALKTTELRQKDEGLSIISNDNGEEITLSLEDGVWLAKVKVKADDNGTVYNYSKVLERDIECKNGILFILEEPLCSNLEVVSEQHVVTEDFLTTKEDSLYLINNCYLQCSVFESNQMRLENMRISHQTISPYDNVVSDGFSSGYRVINNINYFLAHIDNDRKRNVSAESLAYIAQMRAIRAFTYYNMAMLWGRIILITAPMTSIYDVENMSNVPQSSQEEVFEFAYNDICEALKYLPNEYDNNSQYYFARDAALMLKAEIELTKKRNGDAIITLHQVEPANKILSFADAESVETPIYTSNHYQLFLREAEGNVTGTDWQSLLELSYGYWAALKRLGKAQEITSCAEHELLLPLPGNEIMLNPNMTQNPGY